MFSIIHDSDANSFEKNLDVAKFLVGKNWHIVISPPLIPIRVKVFCMSLHYLHKGKTLRVGLALGMHGLVCKIATPTDRVCFVCFTVARPTASKHASQSRRQSYFLSRASRSHPARAVVQASCELAKRNGAGAGINLCQARLHHGKLRFLHAGLCPWRSARQLLMHGGMRLNTFNVLIPTVTALEDRESTIDPPENAIKRACKTMHDNRNPLCSHENHTHAISSIDTSNQVLPGLS